MTRRYLLATDGSESSETSEEFVRDFLNPEHTLIHVLIVIDLFDERKISEFSLGVSAEELQNRHEEKARNILKPRVQKLEDAGFETEVEVTHGRPGLEICRSAEEHDVDGIFLGRGRHSQLGEFFQGSVSHYVVLHSSIPVFVTPSDAG